MKLRNYVDHTSIYYFGLVLMVIGLPLSNFLMSISQFVLAGNWIWEGNFRQKFGRFWQNKSAVILSSVFLLHILGLAYTTDFNYALNDIRIKLPLLILPFIISSSNPLRAKKFEWLMLFFVISVLAGTIVSTSELLGLNNYIREFLGQPIHQIVDARYISLFISHIRFSLSICMAIFTLAYFAWSQRLLLKKLLCILSAIWLIVFLSILESITGSTILLITGTVLLGCFAFKQKKLIYKITFLVITAAIPVMCFGYLKQAVDNFRKVNPINLDTLEERTGKGNKYLHDTNNPQTENGNYVWLYVCEKELSEEWNKRSRLKFDGQDQKGQLVKYTLIRFLTSKGLRKDANGVNALTKNEIRSVEKGTANVNYQDISSLRARIHQIIWEFDDYLKGGDAGGHSVTQRLEFWKTAMAIIKGNPIIGVGTGDVKSAFLSQYDKMNSPLEKKFRLRAHNQYLTFAVTFGIGGLVWFLFSLFYPLRQLVQAKMFDYFYITFFVIALLSMLSEDTLETQAGVSFFAFFNCLLLFGRNEGNEGRT